MSKPIIAIVGRPNVGKSALFNRLVQERISIVEDTPGVTRDRIYGEAHWLTRSFAVIDTGGIEIDGIDLMASTRRQAQLAIEEADLILFVVDVRSGVLAADQDVADLLRRTKKPVLLVVNKVDNPEQKEDLYDFYQLGIGDIFPISAEHGRGIGDLLDGVLANLPDVKDPDYDPAVIKIAVIGRPNVGKSSLVNSVLGQERVIVSDIPGTTRDAIDTVFVSEDQEYVIIDTAGMRRRGKIDVAVERYSVIRSLRAVERADLVWMVLDGVEGVTDQDAKIVGYALEHGKGIVLVVNKWDLVPKDHRTWEDETAKVRTALAFLDYVPITFVSALTGKRVHDLMAMSQNVAEQGAKRIPTRRLNELMNEATRMNEPPSDKGKRLRFYYATQVGVKPPTFRFFVNEPELVHFSYERYLENQLRQAFGFEGTPIRLFFSRRREE